MRKNVLRAPAVPLITVDPYFSVWSNSDKLYDDVTRHWTGRTHSLCGHIYVDGELYRFMGDHSKRGGRGLADFPPIPQKSVKIRPLTTIYTFETKKIRLTLEFMTPLLLDDMMLMSRPISYITYRIEALDGQKHNVMLFFDVSAALATNWGHEKVTIGKTDYSVTASMGEENMLKTRGDDHRIDWGTLHLIAPDFETAAYSHYARVQILRLLLRDRQNVFTKEQAPTEIPKMVKTEPGTVADLPLNQTQLCAHKVIELCGEASGFLCVGYDDIKSIQYFGENIEAYWRKDGDTFADIAKKAIEEYDSIVARVNDFDKKLMAKAQRLSPRYRDIVSVAYRQSVSAHKLTWHDGEVQFFSKENFSNGCIATVDVTYPSIPLFLIYNPTLVEGMLNPIFKLLEKGLWHFDFAPHDVGTYPLANGQVYGMNLEDTMLKQMPVEECGNMLLCVAALCRARKDISYFEKHFDVLKKWADYLVSVGYDPDNQLCTDDFAGHLAHNVNLSAKGILGLAAFDMMCKEAGCERGDYLEKAKEYAASWEKHAKEGDHYKLAFDRENSWSIKYNLVWDKFFEFGLFSDEVYKTEIAYYKKMLRNYGLPLDCRADYTKSDWQMWSTRLTDDKEYFDEICERMWQFLNETPDRVPFTDWYYTTTPNHRSFQARSVQGGLFINLLKF